MEVSVKHQTHLMESTAGDAEARLGSQRVDVYLNVIFYSSAPVAVTV